MVRVKSSFFGDWDNAKQILADKRALTDAMDYAVQQEAHEVRKRIIKGIRDQAPGGKQFLPLGPLTLAVRKLLRFHGKKALIVSGGLMASVVVKKTSKGKAFIGVLRSARGKDGKPLIDVARMQEMGGVLIMRLTPKMRRFLMAALAKSGQKRASTGGGGGAARSVIVIRIPPRPFIKPVMDQVSRDGAGIRRRFGKRIARKLKLTLGSG